MKSSEFNPGPWAAKIGAGLQSALILGFGMTFINMSKTAAVLAPQDGAVDPAVTNAALAQALQPTFIGLGIAIIGIMMIILSAVVFRYRAAWFFRFLCIYGGAAILSPLMPLGAFLLIFALLKKNEFEKSPA